MKTAVVVGASGYAGAELLRLLADHPQVQVIHAAAASSAGQPIAAVHPQLARAYPSSAFDEWEPALADDADIVFLALPHGESAAVATQLPSGCAVVDLGADFRLRSGAHWENYYGGTHAGAWVYGLADLPGAALAIAAARRVANPGCYATVIALAAAPLLAAGLVDPRQIVAVAASGTTGAGRKADVALSASEVAGSIRAYKVGGTHQHTPEIEQTLADVAGTDVTLAFTPLLAPMPRGIHATVSAPIAATSADHVVRMGEDALADHIDGYYRLTPFVRVLRSGEQPRSGDVVGTNDCVLSVSLDHHAQRVVVTAVIDNLGKGAAGQAVQNANLMLGLPAYTGLLPEALVSSPHDLRDSQAALRAAGPQESQLRVPEAQR